MIHAAIGNVSVALDGRFHTPIIAGVIDSVKQSNT